MYIGRMKHIENERSLKKKGLNERLVSIILTFNSPSQAVVKVCVEIQKANATSFIAALTKLSAAEQCIYYSATSQ